MEELENRVSCFAHVLLWVLMAVAAVLLMVEARYARHKRKEMERAPIRTVYIPFDSTYIDSNGHLKLEVRIVSQGDDREDNNHAR